MSSIFLFYSVVYIFKESIFEEQLHTFMYIILKQDDISTKRLKTSRVLSAMVSDFFWQEVFLALKNGHRVLWK